MITNKTRRAAGPERCDCGKMRFGVAENIRDNSDDFAVRVEWRLKL